LFAHLRARGVHGLRVLEVGCSFGHLTEYLAAQPEVTELRAFEDNAFDLVLAIRVEHLPLRTRRAQACRELRRMRLSLGLSYRRELIDAEPRRLTLPVVNPTISSRTASLGRLLSPEGRDV
jgi:hypothetical protein